MLAAAGLITATSCAKRPHRDNPAQADTEMAEPADSKPVNSVVKTLPATVRGADIMKAIAANYKGKVALIDFWATWCGPCRRAMTQIDEIKGDLMKKGCVFLYVTGESSPFDTWSDMIKNIDGDHIRLTEQQWGTLCQSLNIPGIPSYLLLNKDGSTAYDNLSEGGYPGSEILQNNIEVALTK